MTEQEFEEGIEEQITDAIRNLKDRPHITKRRNFFMS